MIIDESVSRQLRDALPTREREILAQALDDIGSEGDDVALVVLSNKADVNAGSDAFIKLLQYGDDQLTLNMKARNSIAVFHCRLEFEKMPIPGMTMQELTRLLNNKLKEEGYGSGTASSTASPPSTSSVSPPVSSPRVVATQNDESEDEVEGRAEASDEHVASRGFTNRDADVRSFLAELLEKHGEGPHTRDIVTAVLGERFESKKGVGLMVTTLVRKGYFTLEGPLLRGISPEETPVENTSIPLMNKKAPTLPDDDPLVKRQRAMADMFAHEAAKKAGLAGKKAELEEMLAQQTTLEQAIAAKRAEIENDEATILSDDALAEFDRLLERYGNSHPPAVEELRKVS